MLLGHKVSQSFAQSFSMFYKIVDCKSWEPMAYSYSKSSTNALWSFSP